MEVLPSELCRRPRREADTVPGASYGTEDVTQNAVADAAHMDPATARGIAHASHAGQRTRTGRLVIEHVEHVAAAVPVEARALAFLHDVPERSGTSIAGLVARGLTPVEQAALDLLTRLPSEPYELHVMRIVCAGGAAGRLARVVKRADLDDHLRENGAQAGAPPYAWARRHIAVAQDRRGETAMDFAGAPAERAAAAT